MYNPVPLILDQLHHYIVTDATVNSVAQIPLQVQVRCGNLISTLIFLDYIN